MVEFVRHIGRKVTENVNQKIIMEYYSYVVSRDFGFAPNPFCGICTLATCKPNIRKIAEIGDWIFGISPSIKNKGNHLLFGMKVSKKITYNEYWESEEYQSKK